MVSAPSPPAKLSLPPPPLILSAPQPVKEILLARSGQALRLIGSVDRASDCVRHCDRSSLRVDAAVAIRDLDSDVVDIVAAAVARRFKIGRGNERQRARRRVDLEQAGIHAARN